MLKVKHKNRLITESGQKMYAHQTWKPYTAKCKLSPWIDVLNELNMELGCFNLETIPVTRNLVEIRYH